MKQSTKQSPRAVLALDLKGAFDNVSIPVNLQGAGCEERACTCVRDFLTGHSVRIRIKWGRGISTYNVGK